MLLILRSSAASSLFIGLFGSLKFFSGGTSSTRGWRWPTGAGHGPCFSDVGFAERLPVWAIAAGPSTSIRSVIVTNVFRILLSHFLRMRSRLRRIKMNVTAVVDNTITLFGGLFTLR